MEKNAQVKRKRLNKYYSKRQRRQNKIDLLGILVVVVLPWPRAGVAYCSGMGRTPLPQPTDTSKRFGSRTGICMNEERMVKTTIYTHTHHAPRIALATLLSDIS